MHIFILSIENENIIQNFMYDAYKNRLFREVVDKNSKNIIFKDCVENNVRVQI